MCYCGKVCDPKHDPWIAPHSCGDKCGRQLMPNCGHTCLLLCHPGRCPPCPKQVGQVLRVRNAELYVCALWILNDFKNI